MGAAEILGSIVPTRPDEQGASGCVPVLSAARRIFAVSTETHRQVLDITARVRDGVASMAIEDGIAVVNCLHTTCCVLINDPESPLIDFLARAEEMAPDDLGYRHNDPRYSDCERGNATAHLRAALIGHGVVVGVEGGRLGLGCRQSILLIEWDGPRPRSMDVHVVGRQRSVS